MAYSCWKLLPNLTVLNTVVNRPHFCLKREREFWKVCLNLRSSVSGDREARDVCCAKRPCLQQWLCCFSSERKQQQGENTAFPGLNWWVIQPWAFPKDIFKVELKNNLQQEFMKIHQKFDCGQKEGVFPTVSGSRKSSVPWLSKGNGQLPSHWAVEPPGPVLLPHYLVYPTPF